MIFQSEEWLKGVPFFYVKTVLLDWESRVLPKRDPTGSIPVWQQGRLQASLSANIVYNESLLPKIRFWLILKVSRSYWVHVFIIIMTYFKETLTETSHPLNLIILPPIVDRLYKIINWTMCDCAAKHRRCFIIVEKNIPLTNHDPRRACLLTCPARLAAGQAEPAWGAPSGGDQ